jgi:hypothetical protein
MLATNTPATGNSIDFTIQFFTRSSPTGGVISTRQFNSHTGPADNQSFFTGVRLVTTGNANEWVGFEGNKIIKVQANGSATVEVLFQQPGTLAYDSLNDRVVAARNAGPNYFGAFYVRSRTNSTWKALHVLDRTIDSLVFRNHDNKLWAFSFTPTPHFLVYNPDGTVFQERFINSSLEVLSGSNVHTELVLGEADSEEPIILLGGDMIFVIRPEANSVFPTYNSGPQAPPSVNFISPLENSSYPPGSLIPVRIEINDPNGDVAAVELYDNGRFLTRIPQTSIATNRILDHFYFPESRGDHTLTAVAEDKAGHVTAASSTFLYGPATLQPGIQITFPISGEIYSPNLNLTAVVSNIVGTTVVEFYSNTNQIGVATGTNLYFLGSNLWRANFAWTNIPLGTNILTAAVRNFDRLATSAPVQINFIPPPASPKIHFISPSAEALNGAVGQPLQISFEFFDINNDVAIVQLSDGTNLLKHWDFSPPYPTGTNRLDFTWVPTAYGEHRLRAYITDISHRSSSSSITALIQPDTRPARLSIQRIPIGGFLLEIEASEGQSLQILTTTSIDSTTWQILGEIIGAQTPVTFEVGAPADKARFYRSRPTPPR